MHWLNNQIDDLLRQIGELLGWLGTEIAKGLLESLKALSEALSERKNNKKSH